MKVKSWNRFTFFLESDFVLPNDNYKIILHNTEFLAVWIKEAMKTFYNIKNSFENFEYYIKEWFWA